MDRKHAHFVRIAQVHAAHLIPGLGYKATGLSVEQSILLCQSQNSSDLPYVSLPNSSRANKYLLASIAH